MSNDKTNPPKQFRTRSKSAWRFVRGILLAYLLVLLAMTFLETAMLYPRPGKERFDRKPVGIDYEEVFFQSADGTKLHGFFFPKEDAKRAILYFHGNAECVADNAEYMDFLRSKLDAALFIFDYRGYGYSNGKPHEVGLIADGVAAQKWLASRVSLNPEDVVLMGRSIGGAVAVGVAAEAGANGLVLINAFSRLTDVASYHFRWLPVRTLMRNRFDSIERVANYEGPVFQSHGTMDEVVPIKFGRDLYEAIPSRVKKFVEHPGLFHNDPSPGEYYDELAKFLVRLPPTTPE